MLVYDLEKDQQEHTKTAEMVRKNPTAPRSVLGASATESILLFLIFRRSS